MRGKKKAEDIGLKISVIARYVAGSATLGISITRYGHTDREKQDTAR